MSENKHEGPTKVFHWDCTGCRHYGFTRYYNQPYHAGESLACHHPAVHDQRDPRYPWKTFQGALTGPARTPDWCPVHPDKKGGANE